MIKRSLLVAVVFVMVGLLVASRGSYAQESIDQIQLSVSPTVFELSANPGDVIDQSFKIVNGTEVDLEVDVENKNFSANGEEGAVSLSDEETSFSLASWVKTSPTNIVLPARGSQVFEFTISVPNNAEPGGHFGSILVKTRGEVIDTTGAQVSQEIGPLLLVKVAGAITEEASIEEFAPEKSFWESGPIIINSRVNNAGNVHFKPRGTIVIKNMFGNEVTTLNLEERNVLPESIRKLVNEWDPGFTVGKYSADLSLVYGEDDNILTSSTSFVIFPYKVVLPVVFGVIILAFVLIRYRRRVGEAFRVLGGRS